MRRIALLLPVCLLAVSCDGFAAVEQEAPEPDRSLLTAAPAPTIEPAAPTPVSLSALEPLTAANLPEGATMVARATAEVPVYAGPGEVEPVQTLEATTIIGTPTVLAVLEGPVAGWARVMLPGRPNGSEGWIEIDDMALYVVEGQIVVDLSDRLLVYTEEGEQVVATTVGVGTSQSPTPTGRFFVTDNVTLADPDSPWGPHALGLSARSEVIMEYNGGDGIIGIHGTNSPGSIGDASSLGCVRVPNEAITLLHEQVPLGTPVEIRA